MHGLAPASLSTSLHPIPPLPGALCSFFFFCKGAEVGGGSSKRKKRRRLGEEGEGKER